MYSDSLLYGKNPTEGIVGAGIKNNKIELFIQDKFGSVSCKLIPFKSWLLSNEKIDSSFFPLEGNLHYKWFKIFNRSSDIYKYTKKYKDKDFFHISDEIESSMVKEGFTFFKGLLPTDLSILSFDIETTSLKHNETAKVLLISNTLRKNNKITKRLFSYDDYENEGQMIEHWCDWVRKEDPSIMCGHNIYSFDIPYLNYIANKYGRKLILGRDNSEIKIFTRPSKFRVDGSRDQEYHKIRIYGRELIDTYFLSIKYDSFSKKYESYALKKIIAQEGLEKKDRVFYDASKIRENYTIPEEWLKIKEYCKDDSDDALSLYDLMSPTQFYWAQKVAKPFQLIIESATGSQLNSILIRSYFQNKHSLPKASEAMEYVGAISYGQPGIYRNCIKWDIASLYPSIILQYNVYDKEKDPNGNFLNLVKTLREERLKHKKLAKETGDRRYSDLEQSEKLGINSAYGMFGAPGLLFNSPSNAAFITRTGRDILLKAVKWSTGLDYDFSNQEL